MNLIKLLVLSTLIFLVTPFCAPTKQTEVSQICDILPAINHLKSENTLVLFDIDDTLIDSAISLSSGPWIDFYWKTIPKVMPDKLSVIQALMWHISKHIPIQAVEKATSHLIHSLQLDNHLTPLALTARPLYNEFIDGILLTTQQLQSVSVDFSKTKTPASFAEHPFFFNGIIFNADKMKGEFLKDFLSKSNHLPAKVIFIDDKLEQIESVESAMKDLAIPVHCFWYRRASLERAPFDLQLANIQLESLLNSQIILSDQEAGLLKAKFQSTPPEDFLKKLIELFEQKYHFFNHKEININNSMTSNL